MKGFNIIPRIAIPIDNRELCSALFRTASNHGKEITDFERNLACYLGVRKTFATSSGRTALLLALRALGLKTGERVIVPAYTCAIVFEVLLRMGLKPTLVDIDPKTYNIDPKLIPGAITSKTKAVIPIHLFGRPCEMDEIMRIANKHDLFVVEDAAQALGAEYEGKKVGTIGDIAIFSFGLGKSITSGEGGAVATNNKHLMEEVARIQTELPDPNLSWILHVIGNILAMKVFSNHYFYGFIRNYLEDKLNRTDLEILTNCVRLSRERTTENLNSTINIAKMPLLCAKMARIQLQRIDEFNRKRTRNANLLTELLAEIDKCVQLPRLNGKVMNTFTRYPVRVRKAAREKMRMELVKRGIDVETPYYYLTSFISSYSNKRYIQTYDVCQNLMTIPNHPCLTSEDLHRTARALMESCM
jgi:dTDP-4-amino-4,6-dideoxygalactose transaminase